MPEALSRSHAFGRTPFSFRFVIGVEGVREVEFRQERSPGGLAIVRMS